MNGKHPVGVQARPEAVETADPRGSPNTRLMPVANEKSSKVDARTTAFKSLVPAEDQPVFHALGLVIFQRWQIGHRG